MITFDKYNFAIYHEENSHDLKRAKEKNNFIFQFKCKQRFRQRVAYSTSLQYEKKMSSRLLKQIENFLKNRNITLIINNYTLKIRTTHISISQNFSLFSLLYLFYNADLSKTCENIKLRLNFIDFVDDINILTYNKFTKRNCKILEKM